MCYTITYKQKIYVGFMHWGCDIQDTGAGGPGGASYMYYCTSRFSRRTFRECGLGVYLGVSTRRLPVSPYGGYLRLRVYWGYTSSSNLQVLKGTSSYFIELEVYFSLLFLTISILYLTVPNSIPLFLTVCHTGCILLVYLQYYRVSYLFVFVK